MDHVPTVSGTLEGISSVFGMVWYRRGRATVGEHPTTVDCALVSQSRDHSSAALPHRTVRRPLGADRAAALAMAGTAGWPGNREDTTRPSRDRQRDPVREPDRDRMGVPAARLPAVPDGVRLPRPLGARRRDRYDPVPCQYSVRGV